MPAPDVLLLGATGWHGAEIARALAAHGVRARRVGWAKLGLATGARAGIRLGARAALPAAVLVRSVPAGSFEQVTLRLSVLHALAEAGVPVVNHPRAIERCVDKGMTCFLLRRTGLPVPESWTTEDPAEARAITLRETLRGRALVAKPLFGSQGRGLRLVRHLDDLPSTADTAGVWHLQRFVGGDAGWHDWRVLVIGEEPVAAMLRRGASWITNVKQGGVPEPAPVAGELGSLAVAAARAVGATYAGVDLIRDAAGQLLVLEVNSMPAWKGLQSVTPFDIAQRLAAHLTGLAGRWQAAA